MGIFFVQMRSTKGISQRDNGVEGCFHGLGDTFGFGDSSHPDFLLVAEVDVRGSVVMVSVDSSIAQKLTRVPVRKPL